MTASAPRPFAGTVRAALQLWEEWLGVARTQHRGGAYEAALALEAVCRDERYLLPELEAYVRAHPEPPLLLVCGGDAALTAGIASRLGYAIDPPALAEGKARWHLGHGAQPSLRLSQGAETRDVTRPELAELLTHAGDERAIINERIPSEAQWQLCWLPFPKHVRVLENQLADIELLLAQRAAVIIIDDTPQPLRDALTELGQKLWLLSRRDLETAEERERFLSEIATLSEDSPEELALRASAAWSWLTARLTHQVAEKKRNYQHVQTQHDLKLNTARHLLTQYRTHWISGVRSVTDSYLQHRMNGPAGNSLVDGARGKLTTENFLSAVGPPSLTNKIDEFVTDRMADFIAGLSGLAAKLELPRIALGDANARWTAPGLYQKLDTMLQQRGVFTQDSRKSGGFAANLIGRKQAAVEERRGQVIKASRLVVQTVESEFAAWSAAFVTHIETSITAQLAEALSRHGIAGAEGLRQECERLDRLEATLTGPTEGARSAEEQLRQWLRSLTDPLDLPLNPAPAPAV